MLTENERLMRRKQAIQWLQADLAMWKKLIATGSPAERDVARKMLVHAQSEADFAAVRDFDSLNRMPAEESAECRELWDSVNAALSGAQNTN